MATDQGYFGDCRICVSWTRYEPVAQTGANSYISLSRVCPAKIRKTLESTRWRNINFWCKPFRSILPPLSHVPNLEKGGLVWIVNDVVKKQASQYFNAFRTVAASEHEARLHHDNNLKGQQILLHHKTLVPI
jgi:hypothetical protein